MADLIVDRIGKQYPTRGEALTVLRNATFELSTGQSMVVLGPSGSGKSTLLYILGTLETPTDGRILLDGQDPFALAEQALARFRNEQIGFVFQDHHLLPQLTVLENVLLPRVAQGPTTAAHAERANQLLKRVGLSERIDHRPAELSGGERQRVALARALHGQPRLLLADEPTGNLDRDNARSMGELLAELVDDAEQNMMLVVVTHSEDLAKFCDRRFELVDGQLRNGSLRGGDPRNGGLAERTNR